MPTLAVGMCLVGAARRAKAESAIGMSAATHMPTASVGMAPN